MPKLSHSIPKYRLHRASGQAIVTLAGKHHYLGPHGTKASRLEYDRLIAEWIALGRPAAITSTVNDLTVSELLAAFLRHAKVYYVVDGKPTAEVGCFKDAMAHVKAQYSRTPAGDFGPLALKAVRQRMVEAGWARTYVNHQVCRLRRIFKWGVENELVPASVLHGLQAVAALKFGRTDATESKPVKPVPDAFVDAVIRVVAPPVAAMIELQRATGMRAGEVVAMRACDIDTTGKVWMYRPAAHKNRWRGHVRCVFLGPKAQEIVRRFLKPNVEADIFSPAEAAAAMRDQRHRNRKTPLSCGNRPGLNRKAKPKRIPGVRYDVAAYRRAITRGCERAKVPHWHPHQLRHNHATTIRREFGLEVARILLGHKSVTVTEIYAEADQEKAVEIAAKIG